MSTGVEGPPEAAATSADADAPKLGIRSPPDADDVASTFQRWIWYASRRSGLHLDGAGDTFTSQERVVEALGRIAASLHLKDDDVEAAAAGMHIERWASGDGSSAKARCARRARARLQFGQAGSPT